MAEVAPPFLPETQEAVADPAAGKPETAFTFSLDELALAGGSLCATQEVAGYIEAPSRDHAGGGYFQW